MIFGNDRQPIFKARKGKRVSRVKVNVTQKNIEALNNEMERAVRIDFINGVNTFKKKIPKAMMDAAFNARGYAGLRHNIPYGKLNSAMGKAAQSITATVDGAIERTITGIAGVHDKRLSMSSDNPALVAHVTARRQKYLQDLSDEHNAHVHHIVGRAMAEGHSSKLVASQVRDSVGLNDRQSRALYNYRIMLAKQGTSDREIERLVKIKVEESLDYRAKMIAVTEVNNASSQAQLQTYKHAEETGLMESGARKQWVIGAEDACPNVCYPMDGEIVGLHEDWTLPNGDTVSIPAQAHPNCRCSFMVLTDDDADNDSYDKPYDSHV